MDFKLLGSVFTAVFIAEPGDKTQIATMLFSINRNVSRMTVFLGCGMFTHYQLHGGCNEKGNLKLFKEEDEFVFKEFFIVWKTGFQEQFQTPKKT